jgi:transposase
MTTTTPPTAGRKGRPIAPLTLTAEERATLEGWARRRNTSQALALRARIVLRCAEGVANQAVAAELGVSRPMVGKWRQRFVTDRLPGLTDAPRSGAPRRITDAQVEAVLTTTLEETPPDATHWSTRSLAQTLGMSQTAVSRIWRAFGLQPHRTESFKLSTDPFDVDKVRDVVGLYLDPPERAVVLCVDEKTQIQALNRVQPIFPLLPGTPERRSHDYARHGTTSLFAALNLATGEVVGSLRRRHRTHEFKQFLEQLDATVPPALAVHLVLDNYATHKSPPIQRWLVRHPRFTLHFIPTGSSWLNLVERWFAELTTKKLQRSAHRSVPDLEADIRAWLATWNANPRPYVWVKTADQILASLKSYCQRINGSGH